MTIKQSLILILACVIMSTSYAQEKAVNVLVFSKTGGFRHKSIPKGIEFLKGMGSKNNWHIDFSEDSNDFTEENLLKYNVLLFLNTTGDIFDVEQKKAFKKYINAGNGFVGIHAASDTEKEWDWYGEMVGAVFVGHPKVQSATLNINKSTMHPANSHLNEVEVFTDEWYNFKEPVGKHVNVLATLDETSYEGKRMGTSHPISWYHKYDGGRIFYTGLGHTIESYDDERFYKHVEGGVLWASGLVEANKLSKKWTNLFEDKLHDNWDVFIGAPHHSVKGLGDIDPSNNGMKGEPLGLNNDPKEVFKFIDENGEHVLHISGEIYGALTSKEEYENYHLKLQFKWGEKIWEPRLDKPRDSGILYHCMGSQTRFWNVWMASQEMQVQEGDVGDYYGLSSVEIDIPSEEVDDKEGLDYVNGGTLNTFSKFVKKLPSHCDKGFDNEKPHGEWNTLELICYEGTSLHIVNGKVVMALFNSETKNKQGQIVPLTKGRIQIQSEAAEVYYKNVEVKSISKIPSKFKKSLLK